MTPSPIPWRRLPILVLGFASLITGLAAGLARLGWAVPLPGPELALLHGPLMVSGFFGTVISLERAVALQGPGRFGSWPFVIPVAAGLGGLLVALGVPGPAGPGLLTLASAGLLGASILVWRRQRALFTATMAGGAAGWLVGNLLWALGLPVYDAVLWWMLFLVLTIAGERLELSRFLPPSLWARPAFLAAVALLVAGAALETPWPGAGLPLAGAGMLALALWLARFDVARRTVRLPGLTRYIALCLFSGYAWLGAAGFVAAVLPDAFSGPGYDAVLHAVFLGFVFAMVFGHAPIILPAVLRLNVPFQRVFYAPLILLDLTLALRLTGDFTGWSAGRLWGGLGSAAAVALFIGLTAHAVVRHRRRTAFPAPP